MTIMPNKSYKIYNGSIILIFEFVDKRYNIQAPIGAKAMITFYNNGTSKQTYGKVKDINLTGEGEGNDKLIFQMSNGMNIKFSSIIAIDIIEVGDYKPDIIDIDTPSSRPNVLLKDLLLTDIDDFYEAFDADNAFSEIGRKMKDLSSGEGGVKGEQGEPGPKGETGEQGIPGADGEQGIQGPKGDDGTPGTDGVDGIQGIEGKQGPEGKPGNDGAKGDTGADGEQGIQGPKGDDGTPGAKGEPGTDGVDGGKGDTGVSGTPGKSAFEYAVDAGYSKTEEDFAAALALL